MIRVRGQHFAILCKKLLSIAHHLGVATHRRGKCIRIPLMRFEGKSMHAGPNRMKGGPSASIGHFLPSFAAVFSRLPRIVSSVSSLNSPGPLFATKQSRKKRNNRDSNLGVRMSIYPYCKVGTHVQSGMIFMCLRN